MRDGGHPDREHDELRQYGWRPRPSLGTSETANHKTKPDRANRCHSNDTPQVAGIERSVPHQLVHRQANGGRRKAQRLDTGSDDGNKQRHAEAFGLWHAVKIAGA